MHYIEQAQPIIEKTYNRLARMHNLPSAWQDLQSWITVLSDDENEYEIVNESRSLIELDARDDPGNGWETWLQMLNVKCPACGRRFPDITFDDPTDAISECPHCREELQY